MKATPQTETMNVLEHGQSVWSYTQRIIQKQWDELRIPNWLSDNYHEIKSNLHDLEVIKDYNIFHDCGKPYCIEYDSDGRKHFPNHAQVSKETYKALPVSNVENHLAVSNLIGWDMVLHTYSADQIKELNLSKADAYTLLITALAEIHSNAEMFGGIESISFKQKWKKLDRRGKMLMKEDLV